MNGCDLYRHFNKKGELMYVGISLSAFSRLCQHRFTAHWFTDIASMTVERFPSPEAAARAEMLAIKAEKPKYNHVHNGNNKRQVTQHEDREERAARFWADLELVSPFSIRRNIICWTPKEECYRDHESYGTGGLVPFPDRNHLSYSGGRWPLSTGGCDTKIHDFNTIERSHFVMSTALGIIVGDKLDADVVHALFWPIEEYRLALPYDTSAPPGDKRFGKYAGDTYEDQE